MAEGAAGDKEREIEYISVLTTDAHYYSFTAARFLPSLRCILLTPLNSLLPGCLVGAGHCDPIQQSITPLLHWPYEFAALSISASQ